MKTSLIFVLSLVAMLVNAQDTLTGAAYTARFKEIKENYLVNYDTEVYAAHETLIFTFTEKMNFKGNYTAAAMKEYGDPLKWVAANIEKTKFKNYEEADREWQAILEISGKLQDANEDFYTYLRKTSTPDDMRILQNVLAELMKEQPEKFRALTDLHAKQLPVRNK